MAKDKNVLLDRLKHLIDKEPSRQYIADKLNCDVSLITKHYNGDRGVTIDYLVKYARFFNVSADYLLGIASEPTSDTTLNAVCEYTGLEKEAVYNLNRSTTRTLQNAINFLLSESTVDSVFGLIGDFEFYRKAQQALSEQKKKIADLLPVLPITNTLSDEVLSEYHKILEELEFIEFKCSHKTKALMKEFSGVSMDFENEVRFRAVYKYLNHFNLFDYCQNGENKTNGKYTRRELEKDMKYLNKEFSEEFHSVITHLEVKERENNAHNPKA